MAQKFKLKVEKREIVGKHLKKLRREGILPGNVYGPEFKSTMVQLPTEEFDKIFAEAGETSLVDLQLGEQTIPVLIHNVFTDFRNHPLHADFYKVNLKEKVKAMIPLDFIGEPKAVVDQIGLLEKPASEIEVEALPTELPENIEVNVEGLAAIDEQITVADLKVPEGVEVLSDPSLVVAKIGELITKEAQEEMEAEAAAAEAAKEEGTEAEAGAEGTQAEGENKEEAGASEGGESKPEEKKEEPQG